MVKASKENIIAAVIKAIGETLKKDEPYLTDKDGHDITTQSDYSLLLTEENGEIVVRDVYPGRIYARITIDAKWSFGD